MELPATLWAARLQIDLIEAIPQVHADWSQGRDNRSTETGAPEQPSRVPLPGASIHVAGGEKAAHVERLADPRTRFYRKGRIGLAERLRAGGVVSSRGRIKPVRGNRKLVVAPKRDSVL